MRPLHQVATRSPGVRRGAAVFAGTRVPLRGLTEHLDRGGSLDEFLASNPTVSRDLAAAALALGLEALESAIPLTPPPSQRSLLPRLDSRGVIVNAEELTAPLVVGRKVLCPGCQTLVFKSWPGGWDAHAEHRCRGIRSTDPEERKAEFKRRFRPLFLQPSEVTTPTPAAPR